MQIRGAGFGVLGAVCIPGRISSFFPSQRFGPWHNLAYFKTMVTVWGSLSKNIAVRMMMMISILKCGLRMNLSNTILQYNYPYPFTLALKTMIKRSF